MTELFYYLGHEQYQPEVLVKHAILAEAAGFDGIFISEHFNPWVVDKGSAGFALSTLGAIAQATKKIKLMTGVITPLYRYHPAIVAQASATIDRLSGGRFILGVGTGYPINEAPLGYKFLKYKERSEQMIEALGIIKRLLNGEKVTFNGTYFNTENAKLYSPSLHSIQVLLAAGGPKSAEIAGEYADGIIVSVKDPKEAVETIIKPAIAKSKKDHFLVTASRWTVFADNEDQAWEAMLAWRGLRAPSKFSATDPEQLQKEADDLSKNDVLSHYTRVNTSQQYIDAYKPLIVDCKADIVAIQTSALNQENVINLLGNEVLPALRNL